MNPLRLLVISTLLLAACSRPSAPHGDEHAHGEGEGAAQTLAHDKHDEHGEESSTTHVDLNGVRGVAFGSVGEPRQEGAWFAAEAVADPGAAAAFSAPMAGIVTTFHAEPGQRVGKGRTLVTITSPEIADLRARWLGAEARLRQARLELEREERLAAAGATSRREREGAEAALAVASADEEAARLALTARGLRPEGGESTLTVRAPRAGTVVVYAVLLGQGVEAGQELGRIEEAGAALARVELPLPGPQEWPPGARTEARHADGRRWSAVVEGVPPALAPETRRLSYRLRLSGAALPLAGTPLEVRVPLARALILPQTALQQIEGVWGVFVREGEEAHFRPVEKGAELGGDVLVLSGLAPGENVATDGAYLLKSLFLKRAGGGGGHDH